MPLNAREPSAPVSPSDPELAAGPPFDPAAQMRTLAARAMTPLIALLGAIVCAVSLAEMLWGREPVFAFDRSLLGAGLMLVAALADRLRQRWPRATLALLLTSVLLGLAATAWKTALGVHMTSLAAAGMVVALAGPTLGMRAAAALLVLHAALLFGLTWGESRGLIDGAGLAGAMGIQARLIGQGLVAVGGLLVAALLAHMVSSALARAAAEHQRVAELLRLGSDWTWELDAQARRMALSPSFEQHTGYRRADFARLNQPGGPRIVEDDDWRELQQVFRERREFRELPLSYIGPDGKVLHTLFSGAPMLDAGGRVTGWRGVGRDVTTERQARLEQQRSETLLNRLFESSPDAICVSRASDGCILLANAGFLHFAGLTQADVLGQSIGELAFWPSADEAQRVFREMHAGGGTVRDLRTTLQLRDGSRRAVLVTAAGFETEGATMAVVTLRDITEIERAKQQAEQASQAKSAFLATMSHEIRTPLNGVLGLARLLQEPGLDGSLRAEYLAHLGDSAQLLSGIVSDVLDLSKIESGHLQVESIVFDLHEVVQGTFAAFAALGQERGLAMTCQLDVGLPRHVRGDPVRVRQIVANYLSNALKFTERGAVVVQAQPWPGSRVRLSVKDSGPGIAPTLQTRLFEPFLQADSSTTRRFGGTGLGLSICRQLARLMGGEVGVESRGDGAGSQFWVELPLPVVAPPAPLAAGQGGTASEAGPLHGLEVLVAEDNAVNMLIVVAMLQRLGAQACEATDGEMALALARRHASTLHVVLMDLHMPGCDGLAATRALRADPATATLPIYAFSAAVLDNERREAEAAGMNGFIAKPVEPGQLLRMLAPLVPPAPPVPPTSQVAALA